VRANDREQQFLAKAAEADEQAKACRRRVCPPSLGADCSGLPRSSSAAATIARL